MAKKTSNNNTIIIAAVAILAIVIGGFLMSSGDISNNRNNDIPVVSSDVQTLPDGTRYLVHPNQLMAGGPAKGGIGTEGGIAALLDPDFVPASDADFMEDNNLVLGLDLNGVTKAYPIKILNWHEIANDFVGDKPVLVSFCPLCRSGVAFDPVIDGERQLFGVSGKLYNSDLVMYDQATDSYWSQILGKAIVGPLSGMELEQIPTEIVLWKDWVAQHPDTLVLSVNTGFNRPYTRGDDIYGTDRDGFSGFGVNHNDNRLPSNSIVFGVDINGDVKAYAESDVREAGEINDTVGGEQIKIKWNGNLETVQVFDTEGNRVDSFGHFWFAWAAFFPDTELYE